jgi:hypothetical protein
MHFFIKYNVPLCENFFFVLFDVAGFFQVGFYEQV